MKALNGNFVAKLFEVRNSLNLYLMSSYYSFNVENQRLGIVFVVLIGWVYQAIHVLMPRRLFLSRARFVSCDDLELLIFGEISIL